MNPPMDSATAEIMTANKEQLCPSHNQSLRKHTKSPPFSYPNLKCYELYQIENRGGNPQSSITEFPLQWSCWNNKVA